MNPATTIGFPAALKSVWNRPAVVKALDLEIEGAVADVHRGMTRQLNPWPEYGTVSLRQAKRLLRGACRRRVGKPSYRQRQASARQAEKRRNQIGC